MLVSVPFQSPIVAIERQPGCRHDHDHQAKPQCDPAPKGGGAVAVVLTVTSGDQHCQDKDESTSCSPHRVEMMRLRCCWGKDIIYVPYAKDFSRTPYHNSPKQGWGGTSNCGSGSGFMAVVDFATSDFETCPKYQKWANFINKHTTES